MVDGEGLMRWTKLGSHAFPAEEADSPGDTRLPGSLPLSPRGLSGSQRLAATLPPIHPLPLQATTRLVRVEP
jgi:hypothetical protein